MTDRLKSERELPTDYQFGDGAGVRLLAEPVGRTGIAIRYVRQYDIKADMQQARMPCLSNLWPSPLDEQ